MEDDQGPGQPERDSGTTAAPPAAGPPLAVARRRRGGLADAAQAALQGLHGDTRTDPQRWGIAARSPGVETLFGTSRQATEPADATVDRSDVERPVAVGPAPDPSPPASSVTPTTGRVPSLSTGRPVVQSLRVHRGPTQAVVAVTLAAGGCDHAGTATALPTVGGVRHALAVATVAAVTRIATEPLLVGVDAVSVVPVDEVASVSVVLSRADGESEQTILGVALASGDEDRAVVHATLDALNRVLGV